MVGGSTDARLERCELRDAAVELRKLHDEFPDRRIALKVDCEGSEYSIVRRLIESDVGSDARIARSRGIGLTA